LESDELFLTRVEVFLVEDVISDHKDTFAFGRFHTPELIWLIRAEISDNLNVFDSVVI
jgi:hypothetical protein